ncbi:YqgE/AlgH family protein [Pedobacter sp. MC2016-15]|uniref:YqgE/AlgH family protein n=1 Tax=Pedobacter sp. MC2016-15 TaxID=2994473 RepID=UPI002245090A|nr:YqgE/AlgH family protein [Pedobacter sp. MC2016-15]MCX2480679.1 YqgE/AlgH family protein [Pedobacter sp. MC2016-15]
MISRLAPSAGKLLISEPFLNDPNFARSVVLLTEHSETGTLGFVVNHPSLLMVDDLIADFGGKNFPVFYGGPVATDTIHFIHRCPDRITDGEEISKGIYWGGNFETLKTLIGQGEVSNEELKFFVGYSGWGEQQLQDEIEANTWIVSDQYDSDMLFSADEEQLWKDVIIHLGPKYAHISNFPQNPNLN